jgi:DNA-binding response OmpR family regulator
MHVLIVENDRYACAAAVAYLSILGYETASASNGEEAISAARREPPDLVICDWQLGEGVDGCEVAKRLQRAYSSSVVMMSAHPMEQLKSASADIDVLSYMPKPVSLARLAAAINEAK